MRRRRLLPVLLGAVLAVSACTGKDSAPTQELTPAQTLAKARDTLASTSAVKFALSSSEVPAGQNGVTAAEGHGIISATEPKFEGIITGTVNGLTGNIPMICIGDKVWWKLFTPDYTPADLASIDAPNPCTLFHPETGIGSLLAATTGPAAKGRTRVGSDVLDELTGTLPGAPIAQLLHLGDGTGSYQVTYGVTEAGQLRQATMTGPFFAGSTSTYTLTLTNYGTATTITAPQ